MPDYIPTKVLLHDPDSVTNPKSLYPVTGLNAIYAGTSGTAATTSITNTSNQIKCEYLELVDSATGKVYTVYLPIEFALEDDGMRPTDKDFQKNVDGAMRSLIYDFKITPLVVTGSVEERVESVMIKMFGEEIAKTLIEVTKE